LESYVRERTEELLKVRENYLRPNQLTHSEEIKMLYTIAVVLLILWAVGLVTSFTIGGFIHILLAIAIIMILLRVINGRGAV